MPRPKASRKTATDRSPRPGHVGDDGGDVGVDGEHAAEADRAGEQGQPHLRHPERRQLAATARAGVAGARRHEPARRGRGSPRASAAGGPEGRAPAELLAEHRRGGYADHVGDREPEHHQGHRAALARRAGPCSPPPARRRRSRRRAAARRRSGPPSAARRTSRARSAPLPTAKAAIRATRRPRRGSRAPRKASTGAPTTTPTAYAEMTWPPVGIETSTPRGDLRQQPHRDELGGADGEAAHRQREHREAEVAARSPTGRRGRPTRGRRSSSVGGGSSSSSPGLQDRTPGEVFPAGVPAM